MTVKAGLVDRQKNHQVALKFRLEIGTSVRSDGSRDVEMGDPGAEERLATVMSVVTTQAAVTILSLSQMQRNCSLAAGRLNDP